MEAKLWSPEKEGEEAPPWKPIWDRREDYGPAIPRHGLYLTAFVDCQLDRLEVEWRAWGEREESWGMDHITVEGGVRDPKTWRKLAVELSRKWEREDKAPMQLGMCLIDGGDYGEDVYHFMVMLAARVNDAHPMHRQAIDFFEGIDPAIIGQLYGHVRASKGFGKHGHPVIDRTMRTVSKNLKGHHIGTWEAKDRIYERFLIGIPLPETKMEGVMHYNKRFGEEFIQQLVREQVSIVVEGGIEVRKYINPKRVRNEGLDLAVGNLAAFRLFNHNLQSLAEELDHAAANVNQSLSQPHPETSQRHTSQGGGGYALRGLKW